MARTQFYNQVQHSVTVGGVVLEDYYEGDDAISWEPEGELHSITRGLDNNAVSYGSQRGGRLTVRLKPTSPSIDTLMEFVAIATAGAPIPLPAYVRTGVEDILELYDCAIEDQGFTTGGPTMQARTFVIVAPNYSLRS